MLFSSMIFLWIFLPAVLILYHLTRSIRVRNGILLAASLLFYAWGEPVYVLLLLGIVALNYLFGRILERHRNRWLLLLDVAANLLLLGYYKYFDFAASVVNRMLNRDVIAYRNIALPLGISFFTFQALSYVIDVYRGENKVQKSFLRLLLYVSFFPQLVAGPIVKYHDIEQQLTEREHSAEKVTEGIRRFIYGLSKKVLLANTLALYADSIFTTDPAQFRAGALWCGAVLYTFQIYFDFSGYSDLAIGLGKMFGFDFRENFRYPYCAGSVREFWRRWHISLSTWFKEYVYIPLGGSRKGTARTYLNLLIVFFVTGLWHGASMNFIVWGLYYGVFLILERMFLGDWFAGTKVRTVIGHIYTALIVVTGWVIFRVEGGLHNVLFYLKRMFTGTTGKYGLSDVLGGKIIVLLITAFLLSGVLQAAVGKITGKTRESCPAGVRAAEWIMLFGLLFLCFVMLVSDTYNPFIYFRF